MVHLLRHGVSQRSLEKVDEGLLRFQPLDDAALLGLQAAGLGLGPLHDEGAGVEQDLAQLRVDAARGAQQRLGQLDRADLEVADAVAVEGRRRGALEQGLAVALAASADFLVTGNLSDFPPDKRRGCAIVSPAEFMQHWRRLQDNG